MSNLNKTLILTIALILLLMTISINAEVPQRINYQGCLTDTNDDPLPDTTLTITFSIYRSDDIQIWTSGPQSIQVTNGLFNYVLGSFVPLTNDIISSTYQRFLGIKVGDDTEIVPRTELISVPYSYKVGSIDGATGGTITGDIELSGAIYAENQFFEIFYPSNILFESLAEQSAIFQIGSKFFYDSELGELSLGLSPNDYKFPTSDGSAGQVLSTDGNGSVEWSSGNNAIPSGVIVMWSGSLAAIPEGWALCDGTNSTPDLRDRFIPGAGNTYTVGETGGTATHTLTTDEMPSHNHGGTVSGSTNSNGNHSHKINGEYFGDYGTYGVSTVVNSPDGNMYYTSNTGSHSHTVTATVNPEGGGQPHENRPPYFALAYIMKL